MLSVTQNMWPKSEEVFKRRFNPGGGGVIPFTAAQLARMELIDGRLAQ